MPPPNQQSNWICPICGIKCVSTIAWYQHFTICSYYSNSKLRVSQDLKKQAAREYRILFEIQKISKDERFPRNDYEALLEVIFPLLEDEVIEFYFLEFQRKLETMVTLVSGSMTYIPLYQEWLTVKEHLKREQIRKNKEEAELKIYKEAEEKATKHFKETLTALGVNTDDNHYLTPEELLKIQNWFKIGSKLGR